MLNLNAIISLLVCVLFFERNTQAQLACANCSSRDTTSYTNGAQNDSLYFICSGQTAALSVSWMEDELLNVQWYRYISVTNVWTPIVYQQFVNQGSYNATIGGFRAVVTDSLGIVRSDDICWVARVTSPPLVNANTISSGCTSVQLSGLYLNGIITGYYNPPPTSFYDPYLFTSSSEIEICFNIEHPILSDLNVEIVTPPACGSQAITLTEIQTPESADSICYNTDAVGLCFSNFSNGNYDLCSLPDFNVGGSYNSYGVNATLIDWSPLLGCDVTSPGWELHVRDCFEGANGAIVSFAMTITDESNVSNPVNQEYLIAAGQNLNILDTGCDSSLFTSLALERIYPAATLINPVPSIQWEAFPPFDLPNGGTNLNILLNPGPTVDTYFTLSLVNVEVGNACGTVATDVEFYDYIPPDSTIITLEDSILCITDAPIAIESSIESGSWIGPLDSTSNGVVLNPSAVGIGTWTISFVPTSSCIVPSEVTVLIDQAPTIVYTGQSAFCSTETQVGLNATPEGGTWIGLGVLDSLQGIFNPSALTNEVANISYEVDGNCPAELPITLAIEPFIPLTITLVDSLICLTSNPWVLSSNLPTVEWSGPGVQILSPQVFNPSSAGVGVHTITANYNQACASTDSMVIVVENPAIEFQSLPALCIDATVQDLAVMADSGYWSGPGIIDSQQGLFDPGLPGAGSLNVYYSLLNSCATTDSLNIAIEDFPNLSLGLPDGICADQSEFVLLANFTGGEFAGPGVELQGSQWYFNPEGAGVGSAEISYQYNDVCAQTFFDTIEVFPLPDLQVSLDTSICPEGQASLTASGAFIYGWTPAISLLTPQEATTIASPEGTTTYTVAGQSVQGCFSLEDVTVEVLATPVLVTNSPVEICPGETELLTVVGIEQAEWTGPDVLASEGLALEVSPDSTTVYTVVGTDANGCVGESAVVVVVHQPLASFSASDTLGVPPLYVQFTNLSQGDYFIWDLGNGDTLLTEDINEWVAAYYQGEEIHQVTLTAYLNGCPSSYSLNIETYYDSELLVIPNVVTADGDGKNDTWWVKTQNMKNLHVDIFNRWGQIVGEIEELNDRWDPDLHSPGTYFFRLYAEGLDQEVYNREGHFTVLKGE
jgi:gliding motility-associated-like protein